MDDLSFLALFDVPPCFVCGKKTKEMEDPLWWCPSQKHGIHIFTCATRGQCECRAAQLLMLNALFNSGTINNPIHVDSNAGENPSPPSLPVVPRVSALKSSGVSKVTRRPPRPVPPSGKTREQLEPIDLTLPTRTRALKDTATTER